MKLIRDGEKGVEGGMEVGGRGRLYTYRYSHHQNGFCIKVGSDESHFNVSLIVRDKVTRQCPQLLKTEKGEPKKQIRTEVPLLTSLPTPYRLGPHRLTASQSQHCYCYSSTEWFLRPTDVSYTVFSALHISET